MTTWERIRYNEIRIRYDGEEIKERRTVILRNPHEFSFLGHPAINGVEVNRDGDEIIRNNAIQQRIITLDLVIKRTPLVASRKYGWLVTTDKQEEE